MDSNTHGEAFGIRGIIPNPLNRSTRVDFAITRAGAAKLEIYDVTGQRVRTLNNGVLAAGKHSVVWDGRGDSGRLVAPGTYYAKLFWAGKSASEKIVLVK